MGHLCRRTIWTPQAKRRRHQDEHDDLSIARALEEDIIFGRLAPGTRLTEDTLLARFSVTRHFARQALVQLEAMGIVVRERNQAAPPCAR